MFLLQKYSNFNLIILGILNLHNPTHISFYGIEIRTDERFYFRH